MSWEYRVMERNSELAIYEVYYYEDGRIRGYSSNPSYPAGNDMTELREDAERYLRALQKPILKYEE